MVTFRCSHCAQRITVIDGDTGAVMSCPACERSLVVPRDSALDHRGATVVPFRHHRPRDPAVMADLTKRLLNRLVGGLLQQRRQLIQTQTVGTEHLAALEARMAQLQKQHRERIAELKLMLAAREAEIQKLRRQKAALLRELEKTEWDEPEPRADLRDVGLLLRM